jgi:integrase
VRVRKNEFAFGSVVNRGDADEMNRQLRAILKRTTDVVTDMLEAGEPVDVAEVKRRVWKPAKKIAETNEVVGWIEEQLPLLGLREGTLKHYRPLLIRLTEWDTIRSWSDVTVENIYKFDAWLHSLTAKQTEAQKKMGEPGRLLSDAAVYNYHKCLKAMLARAYKLGVIDENPYDRMKGELKRGDRETMDYLTDEEMEAFESIRPLRGSVMDVAHDLFVFQMYTGLSYGDMQAFDIKDYRLVDGGWRNVGERIKTGVPFVSQLLPPAVAVLEKYQYQLPRIGNADYNHALKALGMACGINRPLHSHMARHTFATFALRQGVKIENLARMLGHTNITQTQRYAKVVAESVHEEFDKLGAAIAKKKTDRKTATKRK